VDSHSYVGLDNVTLGRNSSLEVVIVWSVDTNWINDHRREAASRCPSALAYITCIFAYNFVRFEETFSLSAQAKLQNPEEQLKIENNRNLATETFLLTVNTVVYNHDEVALRRVSTR